MMNFTKWAAASAVIAIFGACTTEVTDNADGGTSTTTNSGSAGSGGSGTGGSGGSGTGGSGGSGDDGGAACMAKSGDTACRTCALAQCKTELCACEGDTGCTAQVDKYFECISKATSAMEEDGCSTTFVTDSNPTGGGEAGDVASCMTTDTNCAATCQGRDGGPRPRP